MKVCWILWAVWYAYWLVSARHRVRSTEGSPVKQESLAGRLGYQALLVGGFALMIWRWPLSQLQVRLWPSAGWWLAVGLTIESAGLAFAIWARRTLGKNWSARITTGSVQELIIRGPYQFVRHPIYSGLLLAVLGTAIVVGHIEAFVGLLMIYTAIAIKIRREEAALRQHFGTAYEEYARNVPALVPGLG
ncbi:MAG TPA: isoprenylcysteine carboxylmethyltransferase family protein [Terriglobales bacterium]|nr:isoprenylcysteine carboxylmethyltransferase family protein [Terriglobales bacterium]